MNKENIPAFIPTEEQLTSMESFRDAVLGYEAFKVFFIDKLDKIDGYSDDDWHDAFTQYHEMLLDNPVLAISLSTIHGLVDDMQFIPITPDTKWKMGLD